MSPKKTSNTSTSTRSTGQKKTAAGTRRSRPSDAVLVAPPKEVIVRMYRHGLGDCFLLALPAGNNGTKYVVVDCGVHSRQTEGPARLAEVMDHLVASTGSRIDVVVATHEHADHLSGFVQKGSPFLEDRVKIGEVWLAWTEKRGDHQADTLRKRHGTAQRVIEKAVEEARRRAGLAGVSLANYLVGLMDFATPSAGSVDTAAVVHKIQALGGRVPAGVDGRDGHASLRQDGAPGVDAARNGKKRKVEPSSNELALGLLVAKAGEDGTSYCEPGNVLEIDGVTRLRAYVLGPPRSEDLLEKDKPTKIRGAKEGADGAYKEVYLAATAGTRALELSPRLDAGAAGDGSAVSDDSRYPFPLRFRRMCQLSAAAAGERWSDSVLPPETTQALVQDYLHPKAAWRRIDGDWLAAAEQLALNLDSDTNNTSLVLAFEWGDPGSGRVLLFAGDAQVGNWLSWRDQEYGGKKQTADDLLSRVLLYKVGHHGSHNATLRRDPRDQSTPDPNGAPFGLESMKDIVAMIPVDWEAARKKMPKPWNMPHEPLYRRLREKARCRVMRSDQQIAPLDAREEDADVVPKTYEWQPVPGLKGVRWRRSGKDEVFHAGTPGPLYYDLAIALPS